MDMDVNVTEVINYTLQYSMHNLESLSKILLIPKYRLLHQELMTKKDKSTLLKLKKILNK